MFAEVEALAFDLFGDPAAGDRFGDREGDGRTRRRPEDGDADRLDLDPELAAEDIIVARGAAKRGQHGDRGRSESTRLNSRPQFPTPKPFSSWKNKKTQQT